MARPIARGGMLVGAVVALLAGTAHAEPPPAGTVPPPPPPLPSAGGLTAPGPVESPPPAPPPTEADLDESEEEDSGRGLTWIYLDFEGGFQHVGLETFEVDESNLTAGFVASEASGGYVGAGAGVRLLFLTIGGRGRVGFYPDWLLYSIGGEIGLRFQLGVLEPHVELGGGYCALSVGDSLDALGSVNISGGYGRIGGGLDVFPLDALSLGAAASWELLGMTRPGVSLDELDAQSDLSETQKTAAAAEGSGYGSAITIGAHIGLHPF